MEVELQEVLLLPLSLVLVLVPVLLLLVPVLLVVLVLCHRMLAARTGMW